MPLKNTGGRHDRLICVLLMCEHMGVEGNVLHKIVYLLTPGSTVINRIIMNIHINIDISTRQIIY